MKVRCHCGVMFDCPTGHWNRALKSGAPVYCTRACAGEARRKPRLSEDERRKAKAEYDRAYRAKNLPLIKAKKSAYFQRTYDPAKAAFERKARMPKHVAYCRRPEYRAKKSSYDLRHRAQKCFGPFAEAYLALRGVENEVAQQATKYEIYRTNGTLNKALMRRRAL